MMNINNNFFYTASRGQGKSFLVAVFCCCRAILYPNSKIIVASATKGQSRLLISQKIQKELMVQSANLRREILDIQVGQNIALVKFKNGSTIEAVTSSDNARGYRCNILVVDESRMVNKHILDSVLRPFLTVVRQPKFYNKPEYSNYPRENNKEIYMTSAYYKENHMYQKFKAFVKSMCQGKEYFACDFPYQLAVHHGLLTQQRVDAMRQEEDMDEISWDMEMNGIWYGELASAFYKSSEINPCRNIKKAWYPPTPIEYLEESEKTKKTYYLPKQGGEKRIISADIAVMGGSRNDSSVYTLMRLIPQGEEYIRQVVYIETMESGTSDKQALRLKQLFYDFQADYLAIDTQGAGIGVYDALAKVQYDEERDIEYAPFKSFNDDKMSDRADRNALPVVFSIKVVKLDVNHEIAMGLKDAFQRKKMKLLVNDLEGREFLVEKMKMNKKTPAEQARMLRPYVQTTVMVNELINLEGQIYNGFVRIRERGANRKDHYSSIAYGNFLAKILESDLKQKKKNKKIVSLW